MERQNIKTWAAAKVQEAIARIEVDVLKKLAALPKKQREEIIKAAAERDEEAA